MRRLAIPLAVLAILAAIAAGTAGVLRLQYVGRERTNRILVDARTALRSGGNDEAAKLLRTYLGQRPDDTTARREYAEIVLDGVVSRRLGAKAVAEAFTLLEQVIREHPDDHWIRFQVATCQMRHGEVGAALGHLDELRAACGSAEFLESPGGAEGREKRRVTRRDIETLSADGFVKTGRFRAAMTCLSHLVGFDLATRKFPAEDASGPDGPAVTSKSTALFRQLADLLEEELNDEKAAARVVARSTVVNPDDPAAWIDLAEWKWLREKDLPAALDAIAKATAIAPNDSMVMYSNFLICTSSGDRLDEAAAIADRGLALHATEEWPYLAKASLCLQKRDVRGTLDALEAGIAKLGARPAILQVLVDLPDDPRWNEPLEATSTRLGTALAAEERYRKVLEGRVLMARGRWLEAIVALEAGRSLAQGQDALQVTTNLALAKCHERLGDIDLQLAACQRALVETKGSTEAQTAVARALLACGQFDSALAEFRHIAKVLSSADLAARPDIWAPLLRLEYAAVERQRPDRRDRQDLAGLASSIGSGVAAENAALLDAERLAGEGKFDAAIAAIDAARASALDDARLAAAAISLLARGDRPAQLAALIRGLPSGTADDPSVMIATAEACRTLPPSAAGPLADQLLARHPDDLLAAMTALHARKRLGRRDDVAAVAKKIASIAGAESTHAGYANAAAWLLGRQDEAGKPPTTDKREWAAIRTQLAGIDLQRPKWTPVQCLLAEMDLLEGDKEQAIRRYQQALSTRLSAPEIVAPLATLLIEAGRDREAEKTLDGLDSAGLRRLGRIAAELRLRAGKPDEAVAIASRAVDSASGDPDDLLWFAGMLAAHDSPGAATAAIERGLVLAPSRVALWLALADHHAATGDSAAAVAGLQRSRDKVAEVDRPLLDAEIARRAGRAPAAVAAFRMLLEQPQSDPLLLRRAAECFMEAGESADARAALERMLEIRPGTPTAMEAARWARRRLAEAPLRDGSFPEAQKAIRTLRENWGGRVAQSADDVTVAAALLAGRPEPQSWKMALEMLDRLGERQSLAVSQAVLAARLRSRLGEWRRAREDLRGLVVESEMPVEACAAFVDLLLAHDETKAAATWCAALVSRAAAAPETIALQARLALAQDDRPAAVAAAKRLMPAGDVAARDVATVLTTARTMEDLGFMPAADNLLVRCAAVSDAGVLARVGFLIRRNRVEEAVQQLESSRATMAEDPRFALLEAALYERQDRLLDAEGIYRRLHEAARVPFAQRVQAAARLTWCLLDRHKLSDGRAIAERAVRDLGPHPELLDARGVARLAAGDVAGAVADLAEASLDPTPERLLHLAHAKAESEQVADARAIVQTLNQSGFDVIALRPTDRERLEMLVDRLGLGKR